MDFDDFEAKTTRKVRIEANFACNVLLEAILGPVLEGGAWNLSTLKSGANLRQNPGQIYGKIYGNPTTHLRGEIRKIC